MIEHKYLEEKILLCEESDDGSVYNKKIFYIKNRLGEGAGSVCYEAYPNGEGIGVLKEFYPKHPMSLARNAEGQLVVPDDMRDEFSAAKEEYIKPYRMLLQARQSGEDSGLAAFIPYFKIYHGCDEDSNLIGSTYIWMPDPKLEIFEDICEEIHSHPSENSEHQLVKVLLAVLQLAKGMRVLHTAGMIHRDVKASNFGFTKLEDETLTQTLSLFDLDTICPVGMSDNRIVGTHGYMEPEAGYASPNNKTDIYSIGATLFHAIIVNEEVKSEGYVYKKEYYNRISEFVNESELIRASEANSHPRLRNTLIKILKSCLCARRYRYDNCEELITDLETALYYIWPTDISKSDLSREKWVLADLENALDARAEKNTFLSMQYHLYEHPLYQAISTEEKEFKVMVLGFGKYGQKFLDVCLQNGQIYGKKLWVTVATEDLADKETYLEERPEIGKFFNIDGQDKNEDSYGEIEFKEVKFEDSKTSSPVALANIIANAYENRNPNYVFVALGNDELNEKVSTSFSVLSKKFSNKCVISYACANGKKSIDGLYAVYVNKDPKKESQYNELERMAFNTHLVWEKALNIDYESIKSDFKEEYNYDSCVSNAVALKYKLFSLGIDLDSMDCYEAAKQFRKSVGGENNQGMRDNLIWIEHRRWVAEKICLGWSRMDIAECLSGKTKDKKAKKHVCIVKSRPDQKLKEYDYEKWDKETPEDSELDELERMSVTLHRKFVEKAKASKRRNLISGNIISSIRELIGNNEETIVVFQEWIACVKEIWNGDRNKVRLYKTLKEKLLNAAATLPNERKESVTRQLETFESEFYPIMASLEYHDWKQEDVGLIDNIPFILTYTENITLIIPLITTGNTDEIANVASVTVINPSKIIYLYNAKTRKDLKNFKEALSLVVNYMEKRNIRSRIETVLTYNENLQSDINSQGGEYSKLCEEKIEKVKFISFKKTSEILEKLLEFLKLEKECAKEAFFVAEKNEGKFSTFLEGAKFYDNFTSYEFDRNSVEFAFLDGCGVLSNEEEMLCDVKEMLCDVKEMLCNTEKLPYLDVDDIFVFSRSLAKESDQPEFFSDYEELWMQYSKDKQLWKDVCKVLRKGFQTGDIIASFKRNDSNAACIKYYRYIIPVFCRASVEKILKHLKEEGIIGKKSKISGYNSDSCEVIVIDKYDNRAEFDKLFSNVYVLMLPSEIEINKESQILFDNLMVKGIEDDRLKEDKFKAFLSFFEEKGYIRNLNITAAGEASFTYANKQIKNLFRNEGELLETYTYHSARASGEFADIKKGCEIEWRGTEIKNEFDCILTRGFKSLIVECKAVDRIDPGYYYKLQSLAQQLDSNATAVLIADVPQKDSNTSHNEITRGDLSNIVTICKPDEISDIGRILLKIINGEYAREEK